MKPKDIYKSTAWKYFSRYVLLYYSDGLFARCITCDRILEINKPDCHCGHLIKVTDGYSTVFEFENTGVQCLQCNRLGGGMQDVMKKRLARLHGEDKIESLYVQRRVVCKLDKYTLDLLAKEWKSKFDDLVKIKGNPWRK